jgi:hypothetical protein
MMRQLDRWAPLSGVVGVILALLAFLFSGETTEISDSASEVASAYQDDRSQILFSIVLFGFAVVFLLWFVGVLANALREAGQGGFAATALGAAVAFVAVLTASIGVEAGLAYNVADEADAGVVKALSDLTWAVFVLVSFPVATFVGAASLGFLRSRLLPDWFGWAGLVATVLFLLGGTTWAGDGFWAPDGGYGFLTVLLFLLWVLVASVLLFRRPVREPATPVAPAPAP